MARIRKNVEVRREEILDEAIRLIGERGYNGLTVPELARRCGLTNGGLLYHFGSKEGLLMAALDEFERRFMVAIQPMVAQLPDEQGPGERPSLRRVREALRAVVGLTEIEPELMRLLAMIQAEAMDPSHPAHDYCLKQQHCWLETFTAMLVGHVPDPASTGLHISTLVQGFQTLWLQMGGSFDLLGEWDKATAKLLPDDEGK